MIEGIEELRPELQPVTVVERYILEQREVHYVRPWPLDDVATRCPEEADRLQDEGVGVEPSIRRPLVARQVRIRHHVRPRISYKAQAIIGAFAGQVHRERVPRLMGDDPTHLPIAEQPE